MSSCEMTRKLFKCVYLGTKYSGNDSQHRARNLCNLLGSEFLSHNFNSVYESILKSSTTPIDASVVSLKEQNLQARLRMVHTYFLADDRLVLSAGNVDECLVGYLTKYDCSSGDINPIGSISKKDLRSFMLYFEKTFFNHGSIVSDIVSATPSAELTGEEQEDEKDLQLTYDEMSLFGRFRKGAFGVYGPYMMFCRLWEERKLFPEFRNLQEPLILATKVKRFFKLHAANRHKQNILTPALHSESYSPDDNRFDHRQILFDTNWTWQFKKIDEKVQQIT